MALFAEGLKTVLSQKCQVLKIFITWSSTSVIMDMFIFISIVYHNTYLKSKTDEGWWKSLCQNNLMVVYNYPVHISNTNINIFFKEISIKICKINHTIYGEIQKSTIWLKEYLGCISKNTFSFHLVGRNTFSLKKYILTSPCGKKYI